MTSPLGTEAVRLARSAVESEVLGRRVEFNATDRRFDEPSGAFVTLNTYPDHGLRGCIGYPMPVFTLREAIENSGRAACHDPRFRDLAVSELDSVTVEVTVLTVPEIIGAADPQGILDSVEIGRDGLMIEYMGHRGLLLPQVPVEWGWGRIQYLSQLSIKAGLPPDVWTRPGARISRFRGEIYHEVSPYGEIMEGD